MSSDAIVEAFNSHFLEFINDLCSIYPDDQDILKYKGQASNLSKIFPTTLIELWKSYTYKYLEQINTGDVTYFLNKEYTDDVKNLSETTKTLEIIEKLRNKFAIMLEENKKKTVQYIQNLTQLAQMYIK